ncbi:hypothetical protein FCK90_05940 [Kocuria coralli]|uniref:Uncharacterized protein n=1 Tax=Kocuria coralli TaxID=1461025 RepID=A0A5J5L0X0_9MICC|nr:hypothetical protein [Kocuria coralli]KAA9394706.1 hypothetical protein FCK90_05940 [Kocuria coralli]
MPSSNRRSPQPPHDYSASSRTGADQEYTYLAIGMVAGAVPGVIVGLLMSIPLGHAAMWVSVTGGVGILLGLVAAAMVYRRRKRDGKLK